MVKFWRRVILVFVCMGLLDVVTVVGMQQSTSLRGEQLLYEVDESKSGYHKEVIYIVDIDTGVKTQITDAGYNAIWSPDGNSIAFFTIEKDFQKLLIVDANGNPVAEYILHFQNAIFMTWSPDGNRIAFIASKNQNIHGIAILDIATGATTLVSIEGTVQSKLVWLPDSQSLIYLRNLEGRLQPYRISCTFEDCSYEAEPINLIASELPQWSRDGQYVGLFLPTWTGGDGRQFFLAQVSCYDIEDSNCLHDFVPVSTIYRNDTPYIDQSIQNPIWSPDMQRVAFGFLDRDKGQYNLDVVDGSSGQQYRVSHDFIDPRIFTWSRDSQQIAYFYRSDDLESFIYVVDSETGGIIKIISCDPSDIYAVTLAWRP